jgi:hypothetical protein
VFFTLGPGVSDGRLMLEQQLQEAAEAAAAACSAAAAGEDGAFDVIPHKNCR